MEIITTHLEADFDGIASMVAAQKLYPQAHLVLPAGAQPRERNYLAHHPLGIQTPTSLDLELITRLILVDCQTEDRLGTLGKVLKKQDLSIHIFDHHPPEGQDSLAKRAEHLCVASVGATVTLLCEELQARSLPWTPDQASLFALGLYEETGHFSYPNTTPRDFQVGAALIRSGADVNTITKYLRRTWTPPQLGLFNALLQAAQIITLGRRRVLLSTLAWSEYVTDLAPVVQQLGQLHETDAVVVAVAMDGKVQVIGRSRYPDMDMNTLMKKWGGGGHIMASAASVKHLTLVEVEEDLRAELLAQSKTWLPIHQLMTSPVKTVTQETTIKQTERLMTQLGINALPVLDAKGKFKGLTTREDIQKALFHKLSNLPVSHIMQQDVFVATSSTPFEEVQQHMVERNQRVVPILAQKTVVGIFSRTDLLRALHQASHTPQNIQEMPSSYIKDPAPHPRTRHLSGMIKNKLPPPMNELLQQIEELANRLNVRAYLVGGFVRDLLLDIPNFDLDIVIEGDGIQFGKSLAKQLQAQWKVHERFGTVTLTIPKTFGLPQLHHLDVATARTEYYEYPTALPTVERSSIKKDLYRRDFTINALAIRLNHIPGELLDFFGGQRDLKDQVVRVLHSLSFVEDPTRIFRAIRFEQRFGFHISKETLNFIQQAERTEIFHRLSSTRLGNELIRLLREPTPPKGIQRLKNLGLFRFIHHKLPWTPQNISVCTATKKVLDWYEVESSDRKIDQWILYALAWFEPLGPSELIVTWKRLGFSQTLVTTAGDFLQAQAGILRSLNKPQVAPSQTHRLLAPWPDEIVLFLMAKAQSQPKTQRALHHIRTYVTKGKFVKITLTGDDLDIMGLPKGPAYRKILDQLLAAKLDGLISTTEEEYRLAKTLVAKEPHKGKEAKPTSKARKRPRS